MSTCARKARAEQRADARRLTQASEREGRSVYEGAMDAGQEGRADDIQYFRALVRKNVRRGWGDGRACTAGDTRRAMGRAFAGRRIVAAMVMVGGVFGVMRVRRRRLVVTDDHADASRSRGEALQGHGKRDGQDRQKARQLTRHQEGL